MSYGPAERLFAEALDLDACVRLLEDNRVGRVAFRRGDDVVIVPVTYVFDLGAVMFRTGPGLPLDAARGRWRVAFEIDGVDADGLWTVLVNGTAQEVRDPVELDRIDNLPLWAMRDHERGTVIQIAPSAVSGRRIRHEPAAVTMWLVSEHAFSHLPT